MTSTQSSTPGTAADLRCDILLFVVTPTEIKKLEEVAVSLKLTFAERKGRAFNYYDLGQVGTYRVMAVQTEMGPFSHDGSAARALIAKTETRATALVSLGMAFGISREKQKLGDLLVSKILLPYDNRRVHSENGKMETGYENVRPHFAKESLISVLSKLSGEAEWSSKVSFGALLTGGARIHCAEFRDELVRCLSGHGEPVIGGEMEGVGLLAASHPENPIWIIVKGISDFADENRATEVKIGRPIACENAAKFVLSALRNFNPIAEGE